MSEDTHKTFVASIVKPLCESPDRVVITSKDDDRGTLIEVFVEQPDMGRVIGKGGETVNAIRVLLKVLGTKNQKHFGLKINPIQ